MENPGQFSAKINTPDEMAGIEAGRIVPYVLGDIQYRDRFDKRDLHRTEFEFQWLGGTIDAVTATTKNRTGQVSAATIAPMMNAHHTNRRFMARYSPHEYYPIQDFCPLLSSPGQSPKLLLVASDVSFNQQPRMLPVTEKSFLVLFFQKRTASFSKDRHRG